MIGIDILSVKRFKKIFNKKFVERIFSVREISYCKNKKNSILHFAVRFAAKEAVIKALKDKNLNLRDIEILNKGDGSPYVVVKGREGKVHISLSHENDFVVAVCIKS